MCRREAVHHRLCGHVLVHRKRCSLVLNSRTVQKWCFPFKQREERDYCKRCRRDRDDRAAEKEERNEANEKRKAYEAERKARQDERWRRDEETGVRVPWGRIERDEFRGRSGVRVPGGRVEWHPTTRSFFDGIKNLFSGRKRDKKLLLRECREERDVMLRRYDRDGRYDEYYSGEDEVSRPGSLITASTRQTSIATSMAGPSRAGSPIPLRRPIRQPSSRLIDRRQILARLLLLVAVTQPRAVAQVIKQDRKSTRLNSSHWE